MPKTQALLGHLLLQMAGGCPHSLSPPYLKVRFEGGYKTHGGRAARLAVTRVLSAPLHFEAFSPFLLIYPPDVVSLKILRIMFVRRKHFFKKTFMYGRWTQTLSTPYKHASLEGGRS